MAGWRRSRSLGAALAALFAVAVLAGPAAANDGFHHGDDDPAGTIASYDDETNVLVIDLAGGGSVSGVVTRHTWIDDGDRGCGESREARARHGDWCDERRRGDGRKRGDDHGWHKGWRHRGDESDLVSGAVVEDAILVLKDGKAWFAKVELDD